MRVFTNSRSRTLGVAALVAAASLTLAACGGGEGGGGGGGTPPTEPPAPYAASVRLDVPTTTVTSGTSVTLTATVLDQWGMPLADQSAAATWTTKGHPFTLTPAGLRAVLTADYVGLDTVTVAIQAKYGIKTAQAVLRVAAPLGDLKISVRAAGSHVRPVLVEAMDSAAVRWRQVVLDRFPNARITTGVIGVGGACTPIQNGFDEVVDGLLVIVDEAESPFLAYANVCARHATGVPAVGYVRYDVKAPTYGQIQTVEALTRTMLHELGHVLGIGIGPKWEQYRSGLTWSGPQAVAALRALGTATLAPSDTFTAVQLDPNITHWHPTEQLAEIMSTTSSPLITALTIGALRDIGYTVNPRAANYWNPRNYRER